MRATRGSEVMCRNGHFRKGLGTPGDSTQEPGRGVGNVSYNHNAQQAALNCQCPPAVNQTHADTRMYMRYTRGASMAALSRVAVLGDGICTFLTRRVAHSRNVGNRQHGWMTCIRILACSPDGPLELHQPAVADRVAACST